MCVGGKNNYAAGGSVAPNRAQAYKAARKAEGPQKGMTYPELLVDNIVGLDNDYLSFGEKFGQGFNADEIGTLKNMAVGSYEGAKKAVTEPLTTAEELLSGIYDSVSNLATEDLDARLTRMYGVGYQDATGEQVNRAREAVIGDALTAAELVPLGMVAKKGADVVGDAVDTAQKAQYDRFVDRNTPAEFFDSALGKQFYYPSELESERMSTSPTPEDQDYMRQRREAEFLQQQGWSSSSILDTTGMLPVPLRTPVGEDFGTRMMAAMTPEEMAAIRPERAENYGIAPEEIDMQTGIRGAIRKLLGKPAPYGGWYDPETKQIKINKDVPEDYKGQIVAHEMTHADLDASQLDPNKSESGADPGYMARQKAKYLRELGRLSRSATDKDERNFYRDLQNKVRNTTATEFYYLNPGEAMARLAEGDDSRDVRLSALETLNPRLNPRSLPVRGLQALATGLFSETNRFMRPLTRDFPEATGTLTKDYYARVPMDLSKLVVNDPSYDPRNPSLPWTPENGTPDPFRNVGPATIENPAAQFAPGATEANPRLYELLSRANLGDPLTEEEAFDVVTYERYGPLAVGDPDVTYADWQSGAGDMEGAQRIYFLVNPGTVTEGGTPLPPGGGLTFDDQPGDNFNPFDNYDPAQNLYDGYDDTLRDPNQDFFDELEREMEAGYMVEDGPDDYGPGYDVIEDMNDSMLSGGRKPPEPRQVTPITQRTEGIASLYSPSRRAVDLLDRPSYDNIDSLRVQLLNRGAKPDELQRIIERVQWELPGPDMDGPISKELLAKATDEQAGEIAVSRVTRDSAYNDSERTYVDPAFFLGGADNIGANVFEIPVYDQVFSGADAHFRASEPGKTPLMHTRTGMMRSSPSSSPDTYHLGEIQSDWAQVRQKLFRTDAEREEALAQLENLKKSEFFDPDAEGKIRDRLYYDREHGTRGEFDANYPAPYMGSTDKWVQLGLRQSLIDAVNSGSRRMTMSTGDQARGYTGGSKEGQRKFYDDIVPKNLNEVLKKFAKEAGIPQPKITRTKVYGKRGEEHEVPVVEFTDEFIEAIKSIGLPAFAKGGIVPGSSLDVDIFEPIPLY